MQSVVLHVYDLSGGLAAQMSPALLGKRIEGIWHTGVFVFGKEYFFGGGGIQAVAPEQFIRMYGLRPVQVLDLGTTSVSLPQFESFLREISPRFTSATYDLLRHNCNNFSDQITRFLLNGSGIPQHILDLPNEALSTPLGAMLRPMLENMQQQMIPTPGSQAFGGAPPLSSSVAPSSQSSPSSSSFSSRKFIVSAKPSLHFDKLVARVKERTVLSSEELVQLDQLNEFIKSIEHDLTKTESNSLHLSWWKLLHKLLQNHQTEPKLLFPALGIFRVLLLFSVEMDGLQTIRRQCFDQFFDVIEAKADRMSNPQLLVAFSVLINSLASNCAREIVMTNLLRVLPVVFPTLTSSSHDDVRALGANIVYNCSLALQMEEEIVLMTLLSGCSEAFDALLRDSAASATTQEKLLLALGLLLRNFQLARAISVQIGLKQVLTRVALASQLTPLTNEVLALL